jgi:hypothetical protein
MEWNTFVFVSLEGELLACVWACQTLRHYLHGLHFTLITDHEPLKWILAKAGKGELTGQYGRWAMILSEYDMDILHRQGTQHINADVLSRMPLDSDQDLSGARLDEDPTSAACLFDPSAYLTEVLSCTTLDGVTGCIPSPLVLLADFLSTKPLSVCSGFTCTDWDAAGSFDTNTCENACPAFHVDCQFY